MVVNRYLLRRRDGEPNDPAGFITAIPNWEVNEVFHTGDGSGWRLLAVETDLSEEFAATGFNALWTVEPA